MQMLEHFTAFLRRFENVSEDEEMRLELLSAVLGALRLHFAALEQLGFLPEALQASQTRTAIVSSHTLKAVLPLTFLAPSHNQPVTQASC